MSKRLDGQQAGDPDDKGGGKKAQRPFYKKKRFLIPAAFVGLVGVGSASGSGGSDDQLAGTSTTTPATTTSATPTTGAPAAAPTTAAPKAPEVTYAGQLKDDKLAGGTGAPGAEVQLSGWTATAGPVEATKSSFGPSNLCTDVTLVNRDKMQQEYNGLSWKLQSPGGNVQDITFTGTDDLTGGGLAPGGTVARKVCFADQGGGPGQYVLSWAPDLFNNKARGIWLNKV